MEIYKSLDINRVRERRFSSAFLLVHPARQVVFGLQSALGVVVAVLSQTLHELLFEVFTFA